MGYMTQISPAYEVKRSGKMAVRCPICKNEIHFGIEKSVFETATKFPISHVVLHGNPLHALIVYIDTNFSVRGEEGCESIEVLQKSETLSQILKKWSNPF
jgi:hypothetical protein